MRKHYIDNLRWIVLLILIPYHAAQAWNVWGEPNYIFFEGNRLISSIIVFFSPFFMPLLFALAGIGTRSALQKRTNKEYLVERGRRLFVPFLFGTVTFMPVMSYIADKFNCSYSGNFFQHYCIFFTRFTDLTGADGGFSVGQYWFLLYLLIISIVSIGVITLQRKYIPELERPIPFWMLFVLGLPLPLLNGLLSIGGKSLAEYTYIFLIGYFVLSDDRVISKIEMNRWLLCTIGMTAAIFNLYLFIWSDKEYVLLNTVTKYVSEWIMVAALIGLSKRYLNFNGKLSDYMRSRSFLFYIYHFIWVVLFQYLLYILWGSDTLVLYLGSVLLSYCMTFCCSEISIKIPFLRFLTGTKQL